MFSLLQFSAAESAAAGTSGTVAQQSLLNIAGGRSYLHSLQPACTAAAHRRAHSSSSSARVDVCQLLLLLELLQQQLGLFACARVCGCGGVHVHVELLGRVFLLLLLLLLLLSSLSCQHVWMTVMSQVCACDARQGP
jgi:hypothetical protein